MPKSEKGHNSVKYYRNLPKVSQVIYAVDTVCAKYHDPSSNGSLDILLIRFHRFTMHKSEKGDNSVKYLHNFAKSESGHPHPGHNL